MYLYEYLIYHVRAYGVDGRRFELTAKEDTLINAQIFENNTWDKGWAQEGTETTGVLGTIRISL
jgi:hypothetical protein